MDTVTLRSRFTQNTDHTGRFIVTSHRTGKQYFVEPIAGNRVKWGDLNPATGKVEGNYGQKYKGAIEASESMITEANGFKNIETLPPGTSPLHAIEVRDAQYPDR